MDDDSDFDEEELRRALQESQRLSQPEVEGRSDEEELADDSHVPCCECGQDVPAIRARFLDFFDDGGEYVCRQCWPAYRASRVEMGFALQPDAPFDLVTNAPPAVITLDDLDDDARTVDCGWWWWCCLRLNCRFLARLLGAGWMCF
jgi:hypothetical protein